MTEPLVHNCLTQAEFAVLENPAGHLENLIKSAKFIVNQWSAVDARYSRNIIALSKIKSKLMQLRIDYYNNIYEDFPGAGTQKDDEKFEYFKEQESHWVLLKSRRQRLSIILGRNLSRMEVELGKLKPRIINMILLCKKLDIPIKQSTREFVSRVFKWEV